MKVSADMQNTKRKILERLRKKGQSEDSYFDKSRFTNYLSTIYYAEGAVSDYERVLIAEKG